MKSKEPSRYFQLSESKQIIQIFNILLTNTEFQHNHTLNNEGLWDILVYSNANKCLFWNGPFTLQIHNRARYEQEIFNLLHQTSKILNFSQYRFKPLQRLFNMLYFSISIYVWYNLFVFVVCKGTINYRPFWRL